MFQRTAHTVVRAKVARVCGYTPVRVCLRARCEARAYGGIARSTCPRTASSDSLNSAVVDGFTEHAIDKCTSWHIVLRLQLRLRVATRPGKSQRCC